MEKSSKEFAPQSYFDNFRESLQGSKLVFLQQVQMGTEDGLNYFVTTDKARETSMTFYVPNHALLFHMEFQEAMRDGQMSSYWGMQIYMQLSVTDRDDGDEVMNTLSGIMFDPQNDQTLDFAPDNDGWGSSFTDMRVVHKYEPQIANFRHCGWSSRSPNNNYAWNAENACQGNELDTDAIANELIKFVNAVLHITREGEFDELQVSWPPTFTFCGEEREYQGPQHKRVTELYWSRFGDARKTLRQLAKRIF